MANKKIPAEPFLGGLGLEALIRQLTTLWRSLADWVNNATINDLSNVNAPSPADGAHLRYNSASGQWEPMAPYVVNAFGTGAVYTMTTTAAAIAMGSSSPQITLAQAGTYLVRGFVRVFSSAATVSGQSFTLKYRRTNNTAADLPDGAIVYAPMAATTASYTIGVVPMPELVYTTTNTNDVLTIFANISGALGAGSIQVSAAEIIAERI